VPQEPGDGGIPPPPEADSDDELLANTEIFSSNNSLPHF